MDTDPSSLLSTIDVEFTFSIFAVLFLLICSAFISGSEVALFSLSQTDLDELADKDFNKSQSIDKLLKADDARREAIVDFEKLRAELLPPITLELRDGLLKSGARIIPKLGDLRPIVGLAAAAAAIDGLIPLVRRPQDGFWVRCCDFDWCLHSG